MGVRLRLLRDDEFEDWRRRTREWYEADMVASGGLDPTTARAKAEADSVAYPDAASVADHAIFAVENESGGAVGSVWMHERTLYGRRLAWVYALEIDPTRRGRGYGRRAMELAEAEARRRGIDRIELNVFAGNEAARALYRSLGYSEIGVWMGKDLS